MKIASKPTIPQTHDTPPLFALSCSHHDPRMLLQFGIPLFPCILYGLPHLVSSIVVLFACVAIASYSTQHHTAQHSIISYHTHVTQAVGFITIAMEIVVLFKCCEGTKKCATSCDFCLSLPTLRGITYIGQTRPATAPFACQ